jgi:Fe-S oxidoreductase/nitrate reductase gamma subunit
MEIGRVILWNAGPGARWITYVLMVITIVLLIVGIKRRYGMWKMGKPSPIALAGTYWRRIEYLFSNGIFHKSILRESYPGLMHLLIFWGFLCLALGTALVAFQDDLVEPLFRVKYLVGNFYLAFSFVLEVAGLIAIVGILMAVWRRYVVRPTRLDNKTDDLLCLSWILVVLVTGFLVEAARIAVTKPDYEVWSFVGWTASYLFTGSKEATVLTHRILWYVHMLLSFGLIVYIAYSRLLHIITSALNMVFRGMEDSPKGTRGAVAPIADFENVEEFGVNDISKFTWRQLFDLDACTRCGRCQDLCPAYATEKPLSPKQLIQDLKGEWERAADGVKNEDGLIDKVIQEETLWSCTACLACQVNCPVSIPTFDKNIEMRRYLTLTLSKTTPETRLLFKNLQQKYDPYGMGKRQRTEWAENLGVKTAGKEDIEYLYWVGCVASLDERNRKVARAFTTILNNAGVSFGILGQDEVCCGDPARRTGNEDLYLGMAQGNVELLKELEIKKIITTCPHCYNTLKNDYPQSGGTFEVYHQTEFIWKLIREGKISPNPTHEGVITYHDGCYIGRVNGIFDQPRQILDRTNKGVFAEMERNHDRSFCCGGGGGRIWLEEHHKRINHARIDEAIALAAGTVVTACPYCLTMLEDAIKDKEKTEAMKVFDISELVAGSI